MVRKVVTAPQMKVASAATKRLITPIAAMKRAPDTIHRTIHHLQSRASTFHTPYMACPPVVDERGGRPR
jgi:hypothetical protein